jgi:DNA-binding GntR family transcriptional regulator
LELVFLNTFTDPNVLSSLRITALSRDTAVYVEVYRRIRDLIADGTLKFGDQLPGEHALADIMCVGRTSLRTALSLLYEDGYIKIVRGKGSYVAGDSRSDKYKRRFPSGILFPSERVSLLGTLTKSKAVCHAVTGDGFLNDKLSPASDEQIRLFFRLYYLNGAPAVLSYTFYLSSLFPSERKCSRDALEESLIAALREKTITAECECIPVRSPNTSEALPPFSGDNHLLVATTYVGKKRCDCLWKGLL